MAAHRLSSHEADEEDLSRRDEYSLLELPPLPSGLPLTLLSVPPSALSHADQLNSNIAHAAPFLCSFLRGQGAGIEGCRVLELGTTIGACGIFAAGLGARQVIITGPDALCGILRSNIQKNRMVFAEGALVEVKPFEWGSEDPISSEQFDWVIAADLLLGGSVKDCAAICRSLRGVLPNKGGACPTRAILACEHGLPTTYNAASNSYRDAALDNFASVAAREGLELAPVDGWQGGGAVDTSVFEWDAASFGTLTNKLFSDVFLVEVRALAGWEEEEPSAELEFVPEEDVEGAITQGDHLMARKMRRHSSTSQQASEEPSNKASIVTTNWSSSLHGIQPRRRNSSPPASAIPRRRRSSSPGALQHSPLRRPCSPCASIPRSRCAARPGSTGASRSGSHACSPRAARAGSPADARSDNPRATRSCSLGAASSGIPRIARSSSLGARSSGHLPRTSPSLVSSPQVRRSSCSSNGRRKSLSRSNSPVQACKLPNRVAKTQEQSHMDSQSYKGSRIPLRVPHGALHDNRDSRCQK